LHVSRFDRVYLGILGLCIAVLLTAVGLDGIRALGERTESVRAVAAIAPLKARQPDHDPQTREEVAAAPLPAPTPVSADQPAVVPLALSSAVDEGTDAPVFMAALPHYNMFGQPAEPAPLAKRIKAVTGVVRVATAADLDDKFAQAGFRLEDIKGGADVPRLTLVSLPRDLSGLRSVKARKSLFIRGMLPLVLQANEAVRKDRQRLLKLMARGAALGATDQTWVAELAERYGIEKLEGKARLKELKRRVDIVPPSMALAQAAEESGWGTSRFAVEANAVFGQWTYKKGQGIVPAKRDEGKRHEVKAFEGLRHSIAAYIGNLNTHWAYVDFRIAREQARRQGGRLTGSALLPTLKRYSQRGEAYLKTIGTIMRVNGLSAYDRARLQEPVGQDT